MLEDVKITIKRSAFIGSDYKESTPFSDMGETIIRKAELNILTFENDLSGIYNKSGPSSKKRKRDINIYKYNSSVFVAWKKNVTDFFFKLRLLLMRVF